MTKVFIWLWKIYLSVYVHTNQDPLQHLPKISAGPTGAVDTDKEPRGHWSSGDRRSTNVALHCNALCIGHQPSSMSTSRTLLFLWCHCEAELLSPGLLSGFRVLLFQAPGPSVSGSALSSSRTLVWLQLTNQSDPALQKNTFCNEWHPPQNQNLIQEAWKAWRIWITDDCPRKMSDSAQLAGLVTFFISYEDRIYSTF